MKAIHLHVIICPDLRPILLLSQQIVPSDMIQKTSVPLQHFQEVGVVLEVGVRGVFLHLPLTSHHIDQLEDGLSVHLDDGVREFH